MFRKTCLQKLVWVRYIVVAYDLVQDAETTNNMLFDGVGYSHSHCFLELNCFCLLSELLSGDKDPNVPIQGWMDGPDEIKPPSIKGYGVLTSWRLIWCVCISLECTWKCGDFRKFSFVKPMVSHRQELSVGFVPPLVLSIFLQDEFKWGPPICCMEGRLWFPFDKICCTTDSGSIFC